MIRGFIATAIFSGLIGSFFTWLWVRRPRPIASTKERVLLHEAMALFVRLLHPSSLDDPDLLSEESRNRAEKLFTQYQKEVVDK